MTYWDYAATSPMSKEVIDTMAQVMEAYYGNASSLHKQGLDAERLLKRSRETIAPIFGVKPEEIIFTSGGTESNNLAIQGIARRFRSRGNHLITSAVEHASVYETFRYLEREGFRVTYLPVDPNGKVQLEALQEALEEETILVSIMHVNNETGTIQPVEAIGRMLKDRAKTIFHVDAVQSIGKLQIRPNEAGIDLLSASAHKFGGPKGTGFLYCRNGLELEPLLYGGGQEAGRRSGTENTAAVTAMAKALRIAGEQQAEYLTKCSEIRAFLTDRLRLIPGAVIHGSASPDDMAPHILYCSFPGLKAEALVHALEERGMMVSTRSACSSSSVQLSRVLKAMGVNDAVAASAVRISWSSRHTMDEAEQLCKALEQAAGTLVRTHIRGGRS